MCFTSERHLLVTNSCGRGFFCPSGNYRTHIVNLSPCRQVRTPLQFPSATINKARSAPLDRNYTAGVTYTSSRRCLGSGMNIMTQGQQLTWPIPSSWPPSENLLQKQFYQSRYLRHHLVVRRDSRNPVQSPCNPRVFHNMHACWGDNTVEQGDAHCNRKMQLRTEKLCMRPSRPVFLSLSPPFIPFIPSYSSTFDRVSRATFRTRHGIPRRCTRMLAMRLSRCNSRMRERTQYVYVYDSTLHAENTRVSRFTFVKRLQSIYVFFPDNLARELIQASAKRNPQFSR